MRSRMKKLLIRAVALGAMAAIFVGLYYLQKQLQVEQVFTDMTMELGVSVSEEIEDYLIAEEWLLEKAVLDRKEVDEKHPGQYQIYCKVLNKQFTYTIRIEDTTAPTVEVKENIPCLQVNEEYEISDFIMTVSDLSEDVEVFFVNDSRQEKCITFEEKGSYDLQIRAQDPSGNYTDTIFTVQADTPPRLLGAWDRYVVRGQEFDLLQGILAVDEEEGLISEKIEAVAPAFDNNTVGEYEVVYTVRDSNGLETSQTISVIVCEKADAKQYEEWDARTLSEEEIALLCEVNYFSYEPLEEPDYEKTLELVKPTLLNIRGGTKSGSGFIVDINPEYIYCVSVEHVTKHFRKGGNIIFHDDTAVEVVCDDIRLSDNNEVVLMRISTALVPYDTLLSLKQIYVDLDIYSKVGNDEPLIEYCSNWAFDFDDIIKKVQLRKTTASIKCNGQYYENGCIETSRGARSGMSGTAVVDYRGTLVAVVSIVDSGQGADFSMKVDEMDTFKDRITEFSES